MRKSAKAPCVHANPNYHRCTPVPPEWAEIIDLMVFSQAKIRFQKKSEKRVAFIQKSRKITKNRKKRDFKAIFHFFRDFRINVTLFSEKFFGIGFLTGLNIIKSMIPAYSGGPGVP